MTVVGATRLGGGRGSGLALAGLLALVLGCCVLGGVVAVSRNEPTTQYAGSASSPANAPRDEPANVDGPFHYAAVRRTREERPARFDAALPMGPHAFVDGWTEAHPPQSYVRDRVCAGDPAMGERWLAAIAGGPAEESPSDSGAYTRLFAGCVSAGFCDWARDVLRSDRPEGLLRPVWRLAAHCESPAIASLFREREAPPEAYLAWAEDQVVWDVRGGRLPAHVDVAKLAQAVELLAAGDEPTAEDEPALPALLGMVDDPRAAGTLLRMHAATQNPAKRHELAIAMHLQREPHARRVFEADCASHLPIDALCTAPAVSLPASSDATVPALVPVAPGVFSRLHALGLLGTPKPGGAVAQSPMELLEQSGRALRLDTFYDDGDDSIARALAALATPVLDDVLFDVRGPGGEGTGADAERSVLIAWSHGERFEVELAGGNAEPVVGLLNVLARSRGSSVRFVLDELDDEEEVVVGLERSLRAAIAEGLIRVWMNPVPTTTAPGDVFLRALRGEKVE